MDEMFNEKTVAADSMYDQPYGDGDSTQENNPYSAQSDWQQPVQQQYQQPEADWNSQPQYGQPVQPQYQQPVQQQYQQPVQPPYQQQYGQPYQPPVQPPYQQQYQPQQPYYPPQQAYYQRPVQTVQPGGGAAKVFAIVSFVAGCISLVFAMLVLVTGFPRSYGDTTYYMFRTIFSPAIVFAVPGLIFGIVSLAKRTRLFSLGLMGVLFNGLLILECMLTLVLNLLY